MSAYSDPFSALTPTQRTLYETNPQSAYQKWLGSMGMNPFGKQGQFNSGLYNYMQNDYYTQSANNFGLTWLDYLNNMGSSGKFNELWGGLSPEQQGLKGDAGVKWNKPFGF